MEIPPCLACGSTGFGRSGIVPLKFGHVAVTTPEPSKLLAFLREGLGFRVTDQFGEAVTFLTCNHDHHVLNVTLGRTASVHHLAFEIGGMDHHVRAVDTLSGHGIATLWGPTRHTAGHNVASYHRAPDEVLIGLYNDMDVFLPEAGYCEPRPWHADRPQRPKRWPLSDLTPWGTRHAFDLAAIASNRGGPATDA